MIKKFAIALALTAGLAGPALAQEVIRHTNPGSNFPIARAVEVPAGMTTVYLSGAVPSVVDPAADRATTAAYGDMETQTVSVLNSIEKTLADLDLTMGDVIKMQAFLVAPEGTKLDFEGFMKGYTQFFGTAEQPNLPSRSVMTVAGLVSPGWLVEIEVTAVRP
ncbi:endoribonuclease L-PSP [Devosia limi DSM 17137]|uniref:Enamine deaminase RidA, house cleaning of reactive enamine intermediates, YjgF/YER057c/UK114 family n=1 Tax=Devosia limi DSM 17137 TaxID=1121477 RepID=A0A0F5LUC2_9HYPH|nr:RidA family protein [Devosia limi]KKB85749.1 endoribonuclease L-PSP [Devosia limi DSM 17137]SHE31081.1 Enamine deaminase RidA, house cleaning of reactive enamine intermediates, YjgF/YER057c/UK114 family [Devosia limi DSM 17137]